MAKRKRLTPAKVGFLDSSESEMPELETKSAFSGPSGGRGSAPISDVVGVAAATAALSEVSEVLRNARAEGRMIEVLSLTAIDTSYLVRDRIVSLDDDMLALKESLRKRGQQTPIEVMRLENGRYGLISGWRRVMALQSLFEETGDDAFGTVLALLRQPETSAAAYLAMVEENEIRVGLSYYERARIASKAVQQGVYDSEKAALLDLFSTASRAKRSKIRAFLPIVDQLDDVLRFPAGLGERLGLRLSRAIKTPAVLGRVRSTLQNSAAGNPGAEAEAIAEALKNTNQSLNRGLETDLSGSLVTDLRYVVKPNGSLTLQGKRMDADLRAQILAWLKIHVQE